MKKFLRVLSVVLFLALGLSAFACSPKEEEEETEAVSEVESDPISMDILAGTYKGVNGEISTLTLGKNGSYVDDAGELYMSGTYTVDSVSYTMTVNESEYGMTFVYHVTLNGKVLTLQLDGGNERQFCKVEK